MVLVNNIVVIEGITNIDDSRQIDSQIKPNNLKRAKLCNSVQSARVTMNGKTTKDRVHRYVTLNVYLKK